MYGGLYIADLIRSVECLQQDNRALQTKIQALEKVTQSVYEMFENDNVSISLIFNQKHAVDYGWFETDPGET